MLQVVEFSCSSTSNTTILWKITGGVLPLTCSAVWYETAFLVRNVCSDQRSDGHCRLQVKCLAGTSPAVSSISVTLVISSEWRTPDVFGSLRPFFAGVVLCGTSDRLFRSFGKLLEMYFGRFGKIVGTAPSFNAGTPRGVVTSLPFITCVYSRTMYLHTHNKIRGMTTYLKATTECYRIQLRLNYKASQIALAVTPTRLDVPK